MKNSIKALVAVAILAVAGIASAQNSSSVNATASARIIRPITLSKNADLAFGNILAPLSTTATLTIVQGSTPVYSDPGTKPGSQVGTQNAAQFTMTGEPTFSYNISSSPAIGAVDALIITDGTAGLTHSCAVTLTGPTNSVGGTLTNPVADATGTSTFYVGGVLKVKTTNVAGNYSNANTGGTPWSVTVAY